MAALSLYPDIQLIEDAGLITHDPKQDPEGGIVATSAVVFDVRPGNPAEHRQLGRPRQAGRRDPDARPRLERGARWNIVAAYGAAMRGEVPSYAANDPAAAQQLLTDIFSNVTVMDKSANDSIKNAGGRRVALSPQARPVLCSRGKTLGWGRRWSSPLLEVHRRDQRTRSLGDSTRTPQTHLPARADVASALA